MHRTNENPAGKAGTRGDLLGGWSLQSFGHPPAPQKFLILAQEVGAELAIILLVSALNGGACHG